MRSQVLCDVLALYDCYRNSNAVKRNCYSTVTSSLVDPTERSVRFYADLLFGLFLFNFFSEGITNNIATLIN